MTANERQVFSICKRFDFFDLSLPLPPPTAYTQLFSTPAAHSSAAHSYRLDSTHAPNPSAPPLLANLYQRVPDES